MELKKRTIVWDSNIEPPKNYLWVRSNGKIYEYDKKSLRWKTSSIFDPKKSDKPQYQTNGHQYVDLGLQSGTLWATTNVGALTPDGIGFYVSWGETQPKANYHVWSWYKYGNRRKLTKYNEIDNKKRLESEDDAAIANWGGEWITPTKEDWDELANSCSWTWDWYDNKRGWTVTGSNGKSIFLPANGKLTSSFSNVGSAGGYWASDVDADTGNWIEAYGMSFNDSTWNRSPFSRAEGYAVRPIIKTNNTEE